MKNKVKSFAKRSLSKLPSWQWSMYLLFAAVMFLFAVPFFAQAGGVLAGTPLGRVSCMMAGYTVDGLCPLIAVAGFGMGGADHAINHNRSQGWGWVGHVGIATGIIATAATAIGLYGMSVAGCVQ